MIFSTNNRCETKYVPAWILTAYHKIAFLNNDLNIFSFIFYEKKQRSLHKDK